MKKYYFLLLFLFLVLSKNNIKAAEDNPEIGIVEKPGSQLPLDLYFTDSQGNKLQLKDIIDKPTVLLLVYYHCQHICTPLLDDFTELVNTTKLEPGKDYRIITLSFNHRESVADAAKWKSKYFGGIKKAFDPEQWKFMVGDSLSIKKLTSAAGFFFKKDGPDDYSHPTALIILSPEGYVTRYMLGSDFLPNDFKMAIKEAKEGKANPAINKFIRFCFSYDSKSKQYLFNYAKIFGSILFIGIGAFFITLIIKGKNKSKGREL